MNEKVESVIALASLFFIGTSIIVGVNGLSQQITWSYKFDREIGDLFELADRASDASTKYNYLKQFGEALEKNGLTEGQSALYWPRPTSDLAHNYNASKSLLLRLEYLSKLDPKSFEYQTGMQQITLQEFCWFPIDIFRNGYLLKNGVWHLSVVPVDVENRCAERR